MPTTNVLTALGVQHREDPNTNLLAYALRHSARFCEIFLQTVCDMAPRWAEVDVAIRVGAGEAGIPDLVLALRGREDDPSISGLAILEHKLDAAEGQDQTRRYGSPEAVAALLKRFGLDPMHTERRFIYFTRYPDQVPAAGAPWVPKCHQELAEALGAFEEPGDVALTLLVRSWIEVTRGLTASGHVHDDDDLLTKLAGGDGEGSFYYFRNLFTGLRPAGLETLFSYRQSEQGRRYYGILFAKPHWHPEEAQPDPERSGGLRAHPERAFSIHLEPQFHVLTGALNLPLHYEVNPYMPVPEAKRRIRPDDYGGYEHRRTRFIEALQEVAPALAPGLDFRRGGSNQIAQLQLPATQTFHGKRVRDVAGAIREAFSQAAAAVDAALERIGGRVGCRHGK